MTVTRELMQRTNDEAIWPGVLRPDTCQGEEQVRETSRLCGWYVRRER